jgi:hypothetical protein
MEGKVKVLEFRVIRDELDTLAAALTNLLDRQFPSSLGPIQGLQPFLLATLLAARNIYEAIRFLAADIPEDAARKLEFGIAATPLARSLVDLVTTLIYMRDDLVPRVAAYHRGGWRELKEDLNRHEALYGAEPNWRDWLDRFSGFVETLRKTYGISEAEASNLKYIDYWPILGVILRSKLCHQPENQQFLAYLNDWVYKGLSADTHVSAAGIVRLHGTLLLPRREEKREAMLKKFKSDRFFTATTLFVALCTEVNDLCKYGREATLAYLWSVLEDYWGEASDLFG